MAAVANQMHNCIIKATNETIDNQLMESKPSKSQQVVATQLPNSCDCSQVIECDTFTIRTKDQDEWPGTYWPPDNWTDAICLQHDSWSGLITAVFWSSAE